MFTTYWQRNPLWSWRKIGQSPKTLGQEGCVTSNVCTSGSWFGEEIDPGKAVQRLRYTLGGNIYWQSIADVFKNQKFIWRMYPSNFSQALIDEALKNPNKTVQLNVDGGRHWVFALRRIPFTSRYWVYDPWDNRRKFYTGVIGCAIMGRK